MLFSAEITDFRIVHNVLKAISFKDYAIVRPMEEGLKFTLEEMKNAEVSAYIPRNLFSHYHIEDGEDIIFKVGTKVFTECLNIFGDDGNPSVKMTYKSQNSPLNLVINQSDENITVEAEIKTMNVDDFTDVSLAEECDLSKIIIDAGIFTEVLQRLDNCADEITIAINPESPNLVLTSTGIAGESKVDISKYCKCISMFKCKEKCVSKYTFADIRQIFKVMHYADKVAISTGESGLLGLQLIINSDENQMYVEYYVTSQFANE